MPFDTIAPTGRSNQGKTLHVNLLNYGFPKTQFYSVTEPLVSLNEIPVKPEPENEESPPGTINIL